MVTVLHPIIIPALRRYDDKIYHKVMTNVMSLNKYVSYNICQTNRTIRWYDMI